MRPTLIVLGAAVLALGSTGPASAAAAPVLTADRQTAIVGAELGLAASGLPSGSYSITAATTAAYASNGRGQNVTLTPQGGAKIGWQGGRLHLVSGTTVQVSLAGLQLVNGSSLPDGFYVLTAKDNPAGTVNTPAVGGIDMTGTKSTSAWITNKPYASSVATAGITAAGTSTFSLTIDASDENINCTTVVGGCAITLRADHRASGDRSYDVEIPVTFVANAAAVPATTVASGTTTGSVTRVVTTALGQGSHQLTVTAGAASATTTLDVRPPFIDYTDTGATFFEDVAWLAGQGITTGNARGAFSPSAPVTRQAMAAFLARYTGAPLTNCTTPPFSDVLTSSAFCREIKWLGGSGIAGGYGDGTFRPNAPVTRQAMASFLYKMAHGGATAPPCASSPFRDVPRNSDFCGAITWLVSTGVTAGYVDGTYRPNASVSRQAMAAFLHRLSDLPTS